ncbi:MAG: FHA domain-containing serine/threonine-protein kinase [Planctomycetaceae bacterium]
METPLVADAFLDFLDRSGLLTPEQVTEATGRLRLREQPNARETARALMRDGLLTRFQAERLLEGRYRGFFIDHYKVLEILGAGGMACLYLCEDVRTGDQVTLKVLYDRHKNDAGMLARLKLEALAGKRLKHSAIIHTHDIKLTDDIFGDVYYLVMEFIEGVNLEELLNLKGPIPWQQAADFVRQAAYGLQQAHASGMVHRDVKPGNLLVDHEGTVRILDFGLALMDSAEDEEFSLAMIFGHSCLGTADYISPEQSLDSFAVDARTDIYSLGCTLYVALSGKLPYPVVTANEKLEGHRNRPAPPLRGFVPEVPAELAAIVEKMMAKRPEERFQTMQEVDRALAPFARRQPVEFDFPQVLAWRAKQARRRFAVQQRRPPGSTVASSSWALTGLASTSTRRLPQASADTAVEKRSVAPESSVSLVDPFEGTAGVGPLSGPEMTTVNTASDGPALVSLDRDASRYPLVGKKLLIGRDAKCNVRLSSSQVSAQHCELRREGAGWRVVDLGSKNGVQVNGVAVVDHALAPGDRLSIARQHHYRVEYTPKTAISPGRVLAWLLAAVVAATLGMTGLYVARLLIE